MLPISITNDSAPEDNGTVTITLIADKATQIKYTVAPSPNNSAEVTVYDDDSPPTITIVADSGDVAESNRNAGFRLTATGLLTDSTLVINATPAEDGSDFLRSVIEGRADNFSVAFTDDDGDSTYEGELSIPLDDDEISEMTGDFKLTLNNAPVSIDPYRLGSTTEGTITVWDDDAPELKITAGNQITEAENVSADFVISAEVSPNQTITVLYNLSESHEFIESEGMGKTANLDFSNNATEATLSIPITSDADVEDDGTITVTLTPDNLDTLTYTLASSPNHTAIVSVVDDDLPIIVVDANSGAIAESNVTAPFKLSATGLSSNTTLTIKATPNEVGYDFLSNEIANNAADYTVQFTDADNDGIYHGDLLVPLDNDMIGERTGDIKLTLHTDQITYRLGLTTEGMITIWDDDAPELQITGGQPVTEKENASVNFTITSNVAVSSLMLNYSAQSTNFFESTSTSVKVVNYPITFNGNGPYTATLPVDIHNDEFAESDGIISVTLEEESTPATNYTVTAPSPNNTAEVTVYDDDSPKTITQLPQIVANYSKMKDQQSLRLSAIGITGTGDTMLTIQATPAEDGSDFLPEMNDSSFSVTFTDEDGDNTYSGDLSVPLDDDGNGEATGNIKLTLNADTTTPEITYQLGATTEGVITVLDDDLPELRIGDGTSVTEAEGVMAMFPITASFNPDPVPDDNMITVYYTPTQSGNFLGGNLVVGTTTSTTLDFGSGTTATLEVPITDDQDSESNGTITITLADDQNMENGELVKTYIVAASPNNVGTVTIEDYDSLPTISIVADNGTVTEISGQARFELSATGLSADTTLSINATPSGVSGANYLTSNIEGTATEFDVEFTDPDSDGTYFGDLTISLDNDEIPEPTGNIQVVLNADPNTIKTYKLGTTTTGTVEILDDDAPELRVIAGPPVIEADNTDANFTILAKISPNKFVTVRYDLTESQNFILNEGPNKTKILNFTDGITRRTIPIRLNNDDKEEDNGTISVTLTADTSNPINYTVAAAPNNSAAVDITDDDNLPLISIAADNGDVAESAGQAQFTLTATELRRDTAVLVNATPFAVNDSTYLSNTVAGNADDFRVPFTDPDNDGTFTGVLSLTLENDIVGDMTGDIRLRLNANPARYRLSTVTEGVITVWDDDAPELDIKALTPTITEADRVMANFEISAEVSPEKIVMLRYNLVDSHDFISGEGTELTTPLDFGDNSNPITEVTLPVAITSDNIGEENGTITLTLIEEETPATSYTVAPSPNNSAVVNVIDDDAKVLKIRAGNPVTEGDNVAANFTVSAESSPNTMITVIYDLTESHNFIEDEGTGKEAILDFTNGSTEDTFSIDIFSDIFPEPNGTVTVTLTADTADPITYKVAAGPNNAASVTVFDDDTLPIVSIVPHSGSVAESSGTAQFKLTATGLTVDNTPLLINATPAEDTGDFLTDTVAGTPLDYSVIFSDLDRDNIYTGTFAVELHNDENPELTGDIKLSLNANPTTYQIGSTSEGSISILDDDAPEITISANYPTVTEAVNAEAIFTVSAQVSPTRTYTLFYNVAVSPNPNVGDFIDSSDLGDKIKTIDLRNGNTETINIAIANDEMQENDSIVFVRLLDESGGIQNYSVDSSLPRAGVHTILTDDESLPALAIADTTVATAENANEVDFTLSTIADPGSSLMVRYQPAEVASGDFLDSHPTNNQEDIDTQSVEFSSTDGGKTYTGTLTVPIHNDQVGENTGQIQVTLLTQIGVVKTYQVDSSKNIGIARIWDDDAPIISIGDAPAVVESDDAEIRFPLTALVSPNTSINVYYELIESSGTEIGDFIEPEEEGTGKFKSVSFANNATTGVLVIPIDSDEVQERGSTVTVTLESHPNALETANYNLPTTNNPATVSISDDDLPTVSIETRYERVLQMPTMLNIW